VSLRLLPLLLLAAPAAFAAPDFLRPGTWEMKMQIDRNGQRLTDETVSRRCVTADTLQKEQELTFKPFESGCIGSHEHKGKEIHWTYECAGPPPMKGSGKLTHQKDKYWGESESLADLSGGKSLKMTRTQVKFTAERKGDCQLPASKQLPKELLEPRPSGPPKPSLPANPYETRAVVDELGDRVAYVGEREVR